MRYVTHILDILNITGKQRISDNVVTFTTLSADPTITLSCSGQIAIHSVSGGIPRTQTYSELNAEDIAIVADANSQVTINGDVTDMFCTNLHGCDLLSLDVSRDAELLVLGIEGQNNLVAVDVTHNSKLKALPIQHCSLISDIDVTQNQDLDTLVLVGIPLVTTIDVRNNPHLNTLGINDVPITDIDLSHNTELGTLVLLNVPDITFIRAYCDVATVTNEIAQAITDATNIGTVQTNYDGAYFGTINTAAVNAGWTVTNL